jgi:hypothetical protein
VRPCLVLNLVLNRVLKSRALVLQMKQQYQKMEFRKPVN